MKYFYDVEEIWTAGCRDLGVKSRGIVYSRRHALGHVIGLKLPEYSLQITPGIALLCFNPLTTLLNFNSV
jgi:hypothetical protein